MLLIHADEVGWADLSLVLQSMPALSVVGETSDGQDALRLAAAHRPELIFMGATLGGVSTALLLAALRRGPCPTSTVIVLARHLDPANLRYWISHDLQIAGYLLWSDLSRAVLEHCLAVVVDSPILVVSQAAARAFVAMQRDEMQLPEPLAKLTPRERAVLPWLARWDLNHDEIGETLHIDADTVKAHVRHISDKFRVEGGRPAVVDAARAHGLLPPVSRNGAQAE